jgi:hypothetical protein
LGRILSHLNQSHTNTSYFSHICFNNIHYSTYVRLKFIDMFIGGGGHCMQRQYVPVSLLSAAYCRSLGEAMNSLAMYFTTTTRFCRHIKNQTWNSFKQMPTRVYVLTIPTRKVWNDWKTRR